MGKKKQEHPQPPKNSFHPPILSSKLSKALVLQLCWRYFASDPKWKMENDTNRLKAIPRASSSHQKHHGTAPRLLGKMRVFVSSGIDTRMISYHQCWFFLGMEVTQKFKVEYVALLRLFITSFSFWMPAMKSSFLQWSRTNHYQLQLSWGMLDLRIRKKLGVEAQI